MLFITEYIKLFNYGEAKILENNYSYSYLLQC